MINNKVFDLEERTAKFSGQLVVFCKKIQLTPISTPLVNQLIRSGTSIGANYCEANGASSKKDFKNKIYICKKESKETQYWLRIIVDIANPELMSDCKLLWQEAKELAMIFATIGKNTEL